MGNLRNLSAESFRIVPLALDLGVLVSNNLCPSAYINDIVKHINLLT